jgi:NADPH:quinone reductase-like Zn-dependent oxidoreductase
VAPDIRQATAAVAVGSSDDAWKEYTVKAMRYYAYGSPDVLTVEDVPTPTLADNDILVRVRAASVNPLDFHYLRGMPYLVRAVSGALKPKVSGLGTDMAGLVEAMGKNVTRFQVGDEVFGSGRETFAEYVRLPQDGVVERKPLNLTFEQAASVPVAAFTALQALRDKAGVQATQKVLINGAAGGVGTFAVQIAKAFGAEVTGVCSTEKVKVVRSIGADHVIDYTKEDFTKTNQRYDVLIDMAGSKPVSECRQVLTRKGVLVAVGGPDKGQWISPLIGPIKLLTLSPIVSQRLVPFLAQQRREDLAVLCQLIDDEKVTPVIDRTYPLTELPDAIRYLEQRHATGKVVITV